MSIPLGSYQSVGLQRSRMTFEKARSVAQGIAGGVIGAGLSNRASQLSSISQRLVRSKPKIQGVPNIPPSGQEGDIIGQRPAGPTGGYVPPRSTMGRIPAAQMLGTLPPDTTYNQPEEGANPVDQVRSRYSARLQFLDENGLDLSTLDPVQSRNLLYGPDDLVMNAVREKNLGVLGEQGAPHVGGAGVPLPGVAGLLLGDPATAAATIGTLGTSGILKPALAAAVVRGAETKSPKEAAIAGATTAGLGFGLNALIKVAGKPLTTLARKQASNILDNQELVTVYRGGSRDTAAAIKAGGTREGTAFTTNRQIAELFAKNRYGTEGEVLEFRVPRSQLHNPRPNETWYVVSDTPQQPVTGVGRLATEIGGTRYTPQEPGGPTPGDLGPGTYPGEEYPSTFEGPYPEEVPPIEEIDAQGNPVTSVDRPAEIYGATRQALMVDAESQGVYTGRGRAPKYRAGSKKAQLASEIAQHRAMAGDLSVKRAVESGITTEEELRQLAREGQIVLSPDRQRRLSTFRLKQQRPSGIDVGPGNLEEPSMEQRIRDALARNKPLSGQLTDDKVVAAIDKAGATDVANLLYQYHASVDSAERRSLLTQIANHPQIENMRSVTRQVLDNLYPNKKSIRLYRAGEGMGVSWSVSREGALDAANAKMGTASKPFEGKVISRMVPKDSVLASWEYNPYLKRYAYEGEYIVLPKQQTTFQGVTDVDLEAPFNQYLTKRGQYLGPALRRTYKAAGFTKAEIDQIASGDFPELLPRVSGAGGLAENTTELRKRLLAERGQGFFGRPPERSNVVERIVVGSDGSITSGVSHDAAGRVLTGGTPTNEPLANGGLYFLTADYEAPGRLLVQGNPGALSRKAANRIVDYAKGSGQHEIQFREPYAPVSKVPIQTPKTGLELAGLLKQAEEVPSYYPGQAGGGRKPPGPPAPPGGGPQPFGMFEEPSGAQGRLFGQSFEPGPAGTAETAEQFRLRTAQQPIGAPGPEVPTTRGVEQPEFSDLPAPQYPPLRFNLLRELQGLIGSTMASKASLDIGALGRQAQVLGWANPKKWAGLFIPSIRAGFSEQAAQAIMKDVRSLPWSAEIDSGPKAGLGFHNRLPGRNAGHEYEYGIGVSPVERAGGFVGLNDSYISRLVQRLPWIRGSERTYAVTLNKQGYETFNDVAENMWNSGWSNVTTEKQVADRAKLWQALRDVTNHGRGYGDFNAGVLGKSVSTFFSGRNLVSRFQVMLDPFLQPGALWKASPRQLAAKNLVSMVAGDLALLGFLSGVGALTGLGKVEWNPTKPGADWLKYRVGNTRLDPWGGFNPIGRLIVKMNQAALTESGIKKTQWDIQDAKDALVTFFSNKESPVVRLFTDATQITQPLEKGKKFLSPQTLADLWAPFVVDDVWKAVKEHGVYGASVLPFSEAGVGVQTYKAYQDTAAGLLQNIPQYRGLDPNTRLKIYGKGTPGQDNYEPGFLDRVQDARRELIDQGVPQDQVTAVPVENFIKVMGAKEGLTPEEQAWAVILSKPSVADKYLNPDWINFIIQHEDELRQQRPLMFDQQLREILRVAHGGKVATQ